MINEYGANGCFINMEVACILITTRTRKQYLKRLKDSKDRAVYLTKLPLALVKLLR